jgi:hypothetical protein
MINDVPTAQYVNTNVNEIVNYLVSKSGLWHFSTRWGKSAAQIGQGRIAEYRNGRRGFAHG